MHTATILLLLVAPLAGLAAPIVRHSSPDHIFRPKVFPRDSSRLCHRRWRHHGHLTFRLARLDSCSEVSDQHIHAHTAESRPDPRDPKVVTSSSWTR